LGSRKVAVRTEVSVGENGGKKEPRKNLKIEMNLMVQ
jgi:hypothetical protein